MAVVRKQILLEAAQNERLQKLRRATGSSESEIVRRALEAYDPEDGKGLVENAELRELLDALVEQNAKTAKALDEAEAEIAATQRFFAELRSKRAAPVRARARRVKRRTSAR